MTAKQLANRIESFNDSPEFRAANLCLKLNSRNGYYALDRIEDRETGSITNIDCGTLKEIRLTFNGILYGIYAK